MDFGIIRGENRLTSTPSQTGQSVTKPAPPLVDTHSISPYAQDKVDQMKDKQKPNSGAAAPAPASAPAAAPPADPADPGAGAAPAGATGAAGVPAGQAAGQAGAAAQSAATPEQQAISQAVNTALQGFPPELVAMFGQIAQAYVELLKNNPGTAQTQAAAAKNAGAAIQNNPVVEDPQQRTQLANAVQQLIELLNKSFGTTGNRSQAQAMTA